MDSKVNALAKDSSYHYQINTSFVLLFLRMNNDLHIKFKILCKKESNSQKINSSYTGSVNKLKRFKFNNGKRNKYLRYDCTEFCSIKKLSGEMAKINLLKFYL